MSSSMPVQLGWKINKKSIVIVQNSTVSYTVTINPIDMDGVVYTNLVNFSAKLTIVNKAKKIVLVLVSPADIELSRNVGLDLIIKINFDSLVLDSGDYVADLLVTNDADSNMQYPLFLNINMINSYSRVGV